MAITHTDYILQTNPTLGPVTPVVGVWVRLHNNSTGTDYFSTAITDGQGSFTHSAPPGDYLLYTGTAADAPDTQFLRNSHYAVPVTAGDDIVARSNTDLVNGPYAPTLPGNAAVATPAGVTVGKVWDYGGAVFNVRSYGALGLGADETTLIQNAINAAQAVSGSQTGATVYFPP